MEELVDASFATSLVTVAVCALTYHRPEGLQALLEGLRNLRVPAGYRTELVIVDNDPDGSGGLVVRRAGPMPMPVTYEIERRPGISAGRNHAVRLARAADADLVAFLDDDEVPDPGWLEELLAVQRSSGAGVVTGPVLPRFTAPPPAWVRRGRFFERPRYPSGTPIHYARTSNVLIAADVFPTDDEPFAESFGLSGGEDTHFFLRARLAGHRIVWADEARVVESVPDQRMTTSWLVRREYRRGNTLSLCLRDLRGSPLRYARRVAQGAFRIVQGLALLAGALLGGRAAAVRGLQRIAFGLGLVTGLAGLRYDEYRTAASR